MSPTVFLVTDNASFETSYRTRLSELGLGAQTIDPDQVGGRLGKGSAALIDASCRLFDEDELLAVVGLARALQAIPAVILPPGEALANIEDVLDDLCPGLVARDGNDTGRLAGVLARRCDETRGKRFEYVTVSPRPNEVLAIMGDGTAALLTRPLGPDDDGTAIDSIAMEEDASAAVLALASDKRVTLRAASVGSGTTAGNGAATQANGGSDAPVDGARLGARLRELRLAAGLTQAELARRTGIHRPNIARVEAGRHTPSLETLARLAAAIGVPTTRVLEG